jgi:hypothetical protein
MGLPVRDLAPAIRSLDLLLSRQQLNLQIREVSEYIPRKLPHFMDFIFISRRGTRSANVLVRDTKYMQARGNVAIVQMYLPEKAGAFTRLSGKSDLLIERFGKSCCSIG